MAKKKEKMERPPEEGKQPLQRMQLPIKWNVPDELKSIYASNMLVQMLENEFKILFFETKPSPRTSLDDPKETEVRADCVASVIISPLKMPAFIEVLQRQFAAFLQRGGMRVDPETKELIPIEPEQPS